MNTLKSHYFIHNGNPQTLCGILDRDGIIFQSEKKVTCKRCLKSLSIIRKTITKPIIIESKSKSEFVYTGSPDDFEITDLIDWLTSVKDQGYDEIYWNVNMDRFEQLDSIEITVFKSNQK